MNYAVVNKSTNKVENIINADSFVVNELQIALDAKLVQADDIALHVDDDFNEEDGKFYREGIEVLKILPVSEQIQIAIDNYTLELIDGGII